MLVLNRLPLSIGGTDAAGRPRLSAAQLAFFYIGVPLLISLPLGWFRSGPGFSLLASLVWWSLVWIVAWALSELFSRMAAVVLRPWRPSLWLVLALGALVNMGIASYYHSALVPIVAPLDTTGLAERFAQMPRDRFASGYLIELLRSGVSGVTLWVIANYLFEYATRVPRFPDSTSPRRWMRTAQAREQSSDDQKTSASIDQQTSASVEQAASTSGSGVQPDSTPLFLKRVRKLAGMSVADLLAVEAQDHFIQIHAAQGTELLHYRFGDAVRELGPLPGAQIHRSFWVAKHAVRHIDRRGRAWHLVLLNGLRVPVSHANRGLVETLTARGGV